MKNPKTEQEQKKKKNSQTGRNSSSNVTHTLQGANAAWTQCTAHEVTQIKLTDSTTKGLTLNTSGIFSL